MKSEKDVKRRIQKALDKYNWFWWMPPMNGFGKVGVSDVNALRGGVFLAIEAKFDKNKPTVPQLAFLNSITAESGFGFVVSDKNIEHFEKWLELFDRSQGRMQRGEKIPPEDGSAMLDCIAAMTVPLAQFKE